MAIVKVSGIVSNVAKERVIHLWETFDVNGRTVYRKWTIWAEVPWGVAKDDFLEVEGDLGTKIGSYEKDGETKTVVEHSLNSPRLITHKPTTEQLGKFGYQSHAEVLASVDTDEAPF